MSDLLNSASLVMIPSGYKEDTVYSVVPSDGSGDLSFTRASNGTRVNSAGLVEVCPWNLIQQSETFNNGYWYTANVTINANAVTAPNGTTTAENAVTTASDSYMSTSTAYDIVPLQTYTQSIYVKWVSGYELFMLRSVFFGGSTVASELVVNVRYGTLNRADSTYQIENVGNGWFRISQQLTNTDNLTAGYQIYPTVGITQTSVISIWGAQVNVGSTAKPYFPTTDRLNVPRLTYQNGGGGCPSLLLEKQSTNLVKYSQDISNTSGSYWGDGSSGGTAVATANYATSPDGTQNATRLQLNEGSLYSVWQQVNFTTPSTSYTYSIWMKAVSGTPTIVFLYDGTGNRNITLTNEWVRYTWTFTAGSTTIFRFGLWSSVWGTSSTADILAWGAQCEASSYPTSYIPTTSSSATRVADVCTKNGIGALIGGTSGTVFFDIKTNPVLSSASYKQFCYYFDSASAQSYMYLGSTNLITTNSNWGSLSGATALVANTRYKIALVYAPNDFALYVNGVSVATASSGTPKDNVNISIGQITGSENAEFVFNQYTHFPSRLTNAELSALTTI